VFIRVPGKLLSDCDPGRNRRFCCQK